MSVNPLIASFATGSYVVTKETGGAYDADGYWVAGTTTQVTVDACIQPLNGYEMRNLPEGKDTVNTRRMYCVDQLDGFQVGVGDLVTIDGESWQVWNVQRWQGFGDTYYKAYITRQETP